MTGGSHLPGMARARTELAAAELLADHGFAKASVSRSFHAAFFAAETALVVLGETRSQHSDVVSAFVRRVVRERSLDPAAGRLLRSLFNRFWLADRTYAVTPTAEARAALLDATAVVEAVAAWLAKPALSVPADAPNIATRMPARPARGGSRRRNGG